ncbi:hsp70-binding protein 1 [Battus philenor]|uniref:hsp70-binding protein 1 n=1 Tax=Battus philenor TaxID=42288 RepID=UPI0035CF7883
MEPNNSGNQIAGAITYPASSESNVVAVPEQPRQPRNLQGLLRFIMEGTKAEDAPGSSVFEPMDEERKKFLEEAFRSLTVDVAQILLKAINVLNDPQKINSIKKGQELPDDVVSACSNITSYAAEMDVANDFCKLGGYTIFPVCFDSENAQVRAEAYAILAEVCQNNPFCQSNALDSGLLRRLLTLLQIEEGVALAKCLYAVSCLTRNYEPAGQMFTSLGGCAVLTQLLGSEDIRVRAKTAFLISYLARHHPETREKFLENETIKILAEELDKGLNISTSCLLAALLAMIEDQDPAALQQIKSSSIQLKKVLEKLWNLPNLKESEYDDERELLRNIMLIFEKVPDVDSGNEDGVDR